MLPLRSVLFHLALVVTPATVVVGQQQAQAPQFPPRITADCDPCMLVQDGSALSTACASSNPIVAQIIARDSGCGRNWDTFCLIKYNDCYNQACGPDRQSLINNLAVSGGPLGRPVNRTQLVTDCPDTLVPSSHPSSSPSVSPSSKPSLRPSRRPSDGPSMEPSSPPTPAPSSPPTSSPSSAPTPAPSTSPTPSPSSDPTSSPSSRPSDGPSMEPSSPPTPSPTPSPSASPTNAPSPSPSSSPTPGPSPSPSTPFPTVDPICKGRPWVITFLYNGGDCSQSDNLQSRQQFDCTDAGSIGPPTNTGEESYITAVPRGGSSGQGSKKGSGTEKSKSKKESDIDTDIVFFAGTVPVGEKYTLNADRVFDKLAAEMTVTIYDEEGGNLLQVVNVHLSCSQPLILFDKYGASEVTQWVEIDGRVVSLRESGIVTGVYEEDLGITDSF